LDSNIKSPSFLRSDNIQRQERREMSLSENSLTVLKKRYQIKDIDGNVIETPEELFWRVANAIAAADLIYDKSANVEAVAKEFHDLMWNLEFLPNSPTLMNAGRELGQLSACFVLPVEDSMEGIFGAITRAAIIHKSGGGTGFSFSRLRARNSIVGSTGGVASGPVSFMKVFNAATEAVKQGGTRRGANMGILRVDHPDVLDFIKCKEDKKELNNFNISIGVTNVFMEALLNDEDYDLIDPKTKEVVGQLNAKEVFDLIVHMAWLNGEPGIVFLDRMNKANVVPHLGEIEATNPCGEQPLLPNESCNLGSINLLAVLKKDSKGKFTINWAKLGEITIKAVHFLDNVIDANKYPLPEIEEQTKKTRKIGLGIMGLADALIRLGIPYNSEAGVGIGRSIMKYIRDIARKTSHELAKTRGVFPDFALSLLDQDYPMRNAALTTVAPTGTLSMIAGVSSGCEPLFAVAYIKNVMDGTHLLTVDEYFKEIAVKKEFYSEELMNQIAEDGTPSHIKGIPAAVKKVFVTAHDVTPEWHIKMQAAIQENVDSAVSKTINFSENATEQDVRNAYLLAYEHNCKGITIYRDGSRDEQVLNAGASMEKKEEEHLQKIDVRPRPETTHGDTDKVKIGCGNLYISVNKDDNGDLCEVFTNVGRAGGCPSQSEATARLISLALRAGIDTADIIDQLKGIRCHSTIRRKSNDKDIKCLSCPDAIGKAIERAINEVKTETTKKKEPVAAPVFKVKTVSVSKPEVNKSSNSHCPECGQPITHESGCVICPHCGYSKCG
jgi:ribonucleoside-diphosphate reductase alpha chain